MSDDDLPTIKRMATLKGRVVFYDAGAAEDRIAALEAAIRADLANADRGCCGDPEDCAHVGYCPHMWLECSRAALGETGAAEE